MKYCTLALIAIWTFAPFAAAQAPPDLTPLGMPQRGSVPFAGAYLMSVPNTGPGGASFVIVTGKKPDPMPLHYAADHFAIDYDKCLMVGDSSNDVQAARAAGFNIICVPYGYNHGNDIRDSSPDLVVKNLIELNSLFARGGLL